MVLVVKGLVTGYRSRLPIVNGVDLVVGKSETVAVLGPNGAGKSTVLKAIGGLLRAWDGEVLLEGEEIGGLQTHDRIRAGVGYVPQGDVVFPYMTVLENLQMGAFLFRRDHRRIRESLAYVYDLFPRLHDRAHQRASTMSGGERQMVALGRTLMSRPKLLIMDEPSLGLSPQFVETVFESLGLLKKSGLSMLLVEQKVSKALQYADSAFVLVEGRNFFDGTSSEVLANKEIERLYLGSPPSHSDGMPKASDQLGSEIQ